MNTDKRLMKRPSGESLSPSGFCPILFYYPDGIINTTYSFFTILTVKNVTLEGNVNKENKSDS